MDRNICSHKRASKNNQMKSFIATETPKDDLEEKGIKYPSLT